MARSRETKIELTAYDDLFQTDESREEAKLSKIRDIPISGIDEFPDHPFKVLMDEDMEQLVESIKRNGVMTPATVRLKEDGRYELISGHRRKKACELAGLETLKCEVKELTRDEAIIVMVESNLQRFVILPSEKAFAYKMRLEAMNRQGQRTDLTSSPLDNKLKGTTSAQQVSKNSGDSQPQIYRFIRLTELVPEILQMVDERQIAFRPAVEISYLTEEQQYTLLEAMGYNDATGNTIPYAGAGFQIYDPNGNLVTMTFTYPEVTTIDTFYTTADGDLITPQTLEYGKGYSLVEVQAPYGYVLNSEPVYFDVVQENSEEESGITVIEVVRSNMAQKGTITVEKSGEVFSSVAGDKGLYQPIFSVSGLEGAVYEITAAEDIVTLDGTVRAKKGEVVDTVTTGKDGTAKSKELYLGKYEVKEITAPYGMVLNEEVHSVELVYAGQNVDVTETGTSFYNERQRVEIDLIKSLAIDEAYGIGKNGEIFDVTFGLYAAEELTAADGKTIPANGLIEVISLDESGHGKAISDLPMGSYYVQETSTNSAYIVSDAKYPVIFEYAGQDTETVRIIANEGEAITNDIIYGSVSGKKSDEDGKALGSAVIGIFRTGTTEFTKENAIVATTSKDDGIVM